MLVRQSWETNSGTLLRQVNKWITSCQVLKLRVGLSRLHWIIHSFLHKTPAWPEQFPKLMLQPPEGWGWVRGTTSESEPLIFSITPILGACSRAGSPDHMSLLKLTWREDSAPTVLCACPQLQHWASGWWWVSVTCSWKDPRPHSCRKPPEEPLKQVWKTQAKSWGRGVNRCQKTYFYVSRWTWTLGYYGLSECRMPALLCKLSLMTSNASLLRWIPSITFF